MSWLLVAGSTMPRALTRHAAVRHARAAAGDVTVDVQVGAGDLAVQAPPLAHQELLGEGRQGGLAGDPAWPWPCHPGCEDGGWLGLLLPIPWPMSRGAGGSPRSWCGGRGGPWCPGSLHLGGQEVAGHPRMGWCLKQLGPNSSRNFLSSSHCWRKHISNNLYQTLYKSLVHAVFANWLSEKSLTVVLVK